MVCYAILCYACVPCMIRYMFRLPNGDCSSGITQSCFGLIADRLYCALSLCALLPGAVTQHSVGDNQRLISVLTIGAVPVYVKTRIGSQMLKTLKRHSHPLRHSLHSLCLLYKQECISRNMLDVPTLTQQRNPWTSRSP